MPSINLDDLDSCLHFVTPATYDRVSHEGVIRRAGGLQDPGMMSYRKGAPAGRVTFREGGAIQDDHWGMQLGPKDAEWDDPKMGYAQVVFSRWV